MRKAHGHLARSRSLLAPVVAATVCIGFSSPAAAALSARLTAGPCIGGHTTATVVVDARVGLMDMIEVVLYERDRLSRNEKVGSDTQPVGNHGKNKLTFTFSVSRKNAREVGNTLELYAKVSAKKPAGSRLIGGSEETKSNVVKIQCKK